MSIIVCVNREICEPCILITNHTRAILITKALKKKLAYTLKERATLQQHQTAIHEKKKSMVMLTFSYFLKYIFITVYSMDCPIRFTVHCDFFETVCPKANHSHSNNNIST